MSNYDGLNASPSRSWDQATDNLLLTGDGYDSVGLRTVSPPPTKASTPPAQPGKMELTAGQVILIPALRSLKRVQLDSLSIV